MYEYLGWHFPDFDRHFARTVSQHPATDYQQATIDAAIEQVRQFDCAVDVGGNIGLHTVRFASKFRSVHSFEPTDINFECLKKNTETFKNTTLHQVGLGDQAATLKIKLPGDSNNCGNFSIVDFDESNDQLLEQVIEIRTLDSYSLAPGLIKIDVQGFDYNVLLGAKHTINQYHPVIIIESESKKSRREIADFLTQLGYVVAAKIRHDQIWVYQQTI